MLIQNTHLNLAINTNLNTSHVNVNHEVVKYTVKDNNHLNTSHVNVNRPSAGDAYQINGFKYISC